MTTWHLVNGLLLIPSKTEAQVTGTRSQVAKFDSTAGIRLADTTVEVSTAIRVLGIIIDRHLTFDDHVTKLVSSCNYHTRSQHHICHLIDRDTANTIECSVVTTRLDYCNAVLHGVTSKTFHVFRTLWRVPYRSRSAWPPLILRSFTLASC